ncbi:MAG: GAF domain-containing protein [Arenibacterium sp.]
MTIQQDSLNAEVAILREREAAMREILQVINKSREDETPVFRAILEQARHLCDATASGLQLLTEDGRRLRYVLGSGDDKGSFVLGETTWELTAPYGMCEAVRKGRVTHLEDLKNSELYRNGDDARVRLVDGEGILTQLHVPLLKDGVAFGNMSLSRREQKPFTADQITLVQTFAEQAVIAIENVRQFREVQARLERERASAEILRTISESRDDETPVFNAILQRAAKLCDAPLADLDLVDEDGRHLREVATFGNIQRAVPSQEWVWSMDSDYRHVHAIKTGQPVHVPDLRETPLYKAGDPMSRATVDQESMRTLLAVPLRKNGRGIGCIVLFRQEQRPFTPDQIALVETFAAQAVIAIENVRQFREVQERLERERASTEILHTISESRDDETPVFEAIVKNAERLCAAQVTFLVLLSDDHKTWTLAARAGDAMREIKVGQTWDVAKEYPPYQATLRKEVVQEEDLKETDFYKSGDPDAIQFADVEGIRSRAFVPLIADGVAIGILALCRRDVGLYNKSDLALVEAFAAQAVIAIRNSTQFREVQERLEREAATKEVLHVISSSRDDETPVFKTILEQATRLCATPYAALILGRANDEAQTMAANLGVHADTLSHYEAGLAKMDAEDSLAAKSIIEGRTIHVPDMAETAEYKAGHERFRIVVEIQGIRTNLFVPLMTPDGAIGCFIIWKTDVAPFTDDQITLAETFAAQAVIAIENVHQFRAVQTKLERESATSEVLSVISQSRDDAQRVFDALLEKVVALSQSAHGSVWLADEEGIWIETVARNDTNAARAAGFDRRRLDATDSAVANCVRERAVWRMDDIQDQPGYKDDPNFPNREWMNRSGARSMLLVPLVLGDKGIGLLAMYRSEVRPYSQEHVDLIEGFAAQAVIAIENTRQFKALETLNAELGARVNAQVGELERMGRLKRFLPSAVADAVVSAGDENMLSSHRALVATLFCDMRGFTAFCEAAEPEETIEVLQTYHQEMSDLIDQYGGGVDQRAGDGIMVIFNDPIPAENPAGDAVQLALAMRAKMRELCAKWKKLGHRLGFGIGISFGYATVGLVGSAGRFDYTASGTSINTAARLCDMAANDEILISPRTWAAIEGNVDAESRGEVEMKGIREPVEVFAILAD